MNQKPKILTIIPARGGSKGLPNKNILDLNGIPLIVHSILSAKNCKECGDVIISTDDKNIANIAKKYKADVPFIRPKELATDESKTIDVLIHSLNMMESIKNIKYEIVILLEPTCPLKKARDIKNCLELFMQNQPGSVVSVYEETKLHPSQLKIIKNGYISPYEIKNLQDGIPRQLLEPKVYAKNGAVYVCRRDNILGGDLYGKNIIPYIMSEEASINIDSKLDLMLAESYLQLIRQK